MKKKVGIVLLVLVGIVATVALVAAFQPGEYRIVRSATIAAPPAVVFAQVDDLHKWQAWSPWARLDPAAKNAFAGPPAGTGAVFSWVGNSEVGEGRMTITESRANELVRFRLDFVKPFASTAESEFTFKPVGERTEVTWSMTGHNDYLCKCVCMFMNMDSMVGGQFEKGLANLQEVVAAGDGRK